MADIYLTAHRGAIEIWPASQVGFLKPLLEYYFQYTPLEKFTYYNQQERRVVTVERRAKKVAGTRVQMYRDVDGVLIVHEGMYDRIVTACEKAGHQVFYEKRDPQFKEPFLDPSVVRGLHPDQAQAVVSVLSSIGAPGIPGGSGAVIDATMGYGKTYLIAAFCRAYRKKIVVTTKSKNVVRRLVAGLKDLLADDGISVGMYQGSSRIDGDVIVATNVLLDCFSASEVDCLIYDECHHSLSDSQSSLVMRLDRAVKIALSATLNPRFDGKELLLEGLFGPKVHIVTDQDGEALGRVLPIVVHAIPVLSGPDLSEFSSPVTQEKEGIWRNKARNALIAQAAARIPEDQQRVVFVRTLEHAKILKKSFLPDYEIYHGSLSLSEDRRIVEGFENGSILKIISTDSLGEGVDPKELMVIIDANWVSSDIKLAQRAGRNRRKATGKSYGVIVAFDDRFDELAQRKARQRLKIYADRGYQIVRDSSPEKIQFDSRNVTGKQADGEEIDRCLREGEADADAVMEGQ